MSHKDTKLANIRSFFYKYTIIFFVVLLCND